MKNILGLTRELRKKIFTSFYFSWEFLCHTNYLMHTHIMQAYAFQEIIR